jgi:hypothetical protein
MKFIARTLFGIVRLFLMPIIRGIQAVMFVALIITATCGLFAFAVFLIGQKMSALQCVGDCVAWAILLLVVKMAAAYLVEGISRIRPTGVPDHT